MKNRLLLLAAALALAGLGACAGIQPPQPWQKGDLARPQMSLNADPLEARFSAHAYFSREAATGGAAVGGGGCGCN
ncbi:MAG: DUF4266 domain-containing protein [Burkholderiales bacterium]|nr:DUF4266 domain-containing protein [Burkholderiales bacterium]MDE1926145.1 DUF4266 domain-containing protein [Burkholderiales bacterium]MDE2159756.1 DUF4266 domain-containing protein [Burkholderiales bacterium]MDE2502931.1 DUF4266 domain-containing protein [Burkholderiales bacterium]